jgi:hypothetical protein
MKKKLLKIVWNINIIDLLFDFHNIRSRAVRKLPEPFESETKNNKLKL